MTKARADQNDILTNGRAANWAPEVAFSPSSRAFPWSGEVPVLVINHSIVDIQERKAKETSHSNVKIMKSVSSYLQNIMVWKSVTTIKSCLTQGQRERLLSYLFLGPCSCLHVEAQ